MDEEIKIPVLKAISAWLIAIATSMWQTFSQVPWDKLAQFAAFLYSVCLIYEYLRKRFRKSSQHGSD